MKTQIINAKTGEVEVRDMTSAEEEKNNQDVENARLAKEASKTKSDANEATKASAKAKLIAGEALTEAEADTIVL